MPRLWREVDPAREATDPLPTVLACTGESEAGIMITLTLHDEDATELLALLYAQRALSEPSTEEYAKWAPVIAALRCALNLCDCGRAPRL